MIRIGLAGWGDHEELYSGMIRGQSKLKAYSAHFPIVEVDSSFYAIQPERNYIKWSEETPAEFGFLVKAFQGMTGHTRGAKPSESLEEVFAAFKQSIHPLQLAGKLKAVLFQYPPWFDCTRENVEVLRNARKLMGSTAVALEFRNQSWFTTQMRDKTLSFMEQEGWIHSICDEPQAGLGSIPTVLHPTHRAMTVVRFHGRNTGGWNNSGDKHWRDVRYLYRYNEEELAEWRNGLLQLNKTTSEIYVIFNNNSGGDAAANAMMLAKLLNIDHGIAPPKQIELF